MFYSRISLLETIEKHLNDSWWVLSLIFLGWGLFSLFVGLYLYKITKARIDTKRLNEDENIWEEMQFWFYPSLSLPLQALFFPYRLYLFYLEAKMHIKGSFLTMEQQKEYFHQMEDKHEYLYWRYTYVLAWTQIIIGSCLLLASFTWSIYSLTN